MVYERRPEDLSKAITDTLSAIAEIAGKSIRTLHRTISLLKNPDEIRTAIPGEPSPAPPTRPDF